MRARSGARPGPLVYLRDRRLTLILALALLAGFLAYQAAPASDIFVGWLGDRLFLPASQGLGAADAATFYGDEITSDAHSGRSRWSRADAQIDLPGLGAGSDLMLTLRAQGWPNGVLNHSTSQPTVSITGNGVLVGQFTPTPAWADYSFRIPANVQASDLLSLKLHISDTFTSTATIADPQRAKGIRLEYIGVRGNELASFTLPAALPLGLLALDGALGLLSLLVLTRRPTLAFVLTTLLISGAAIGLALARAWAVALLPWLTLALVLLLAYSRRAALLSLFERLLHRYARGVALNYGLVAMVAAWLAYLAARASFFYQLPGLKTFQDSFPDSLLYGLLGMGLLLLIIVRGRTGLPRLSNALVRMFGSRRGARAILALALLIWVGYEAYVVAGLPYVGHADYADNAVVARNLLAGRGWVVDYVTQYYQLYSGVTRPQETWPLLQPVWIVPFFALFGPTAWAAKIPNLLFTVALALLIYSAGARLWDRRVGLTAALIILTNYLFFRLVIYTTSDLAFTVFAFAAICLFYRATNDERRTTNDKRSFVLRGSSLVGSGVLTGLMLLQKPASGGLIALGMGLWYLGQLWRSNSARGTMQTKVGNAKKTPILNSQFSILNVLIWGALSIALLSPYLARNIELFHTPFYSTESHDAWVLGYGEWEDIYKVFTTQAGLGTAGVPDRSWVLRWGFDRTQQKISAQIRAMRDYLMPPWKDLPLNLSDQLSGPYSDPLRDPKDPRMLFAMGAWLALLGGISALRSQRRLLGLLLAAFIPYALFLILYWHADEERYFVMLLPWLALLAGFALWRGYDRVAAIGDGRWTPVGLAMVVTALVLVIQPSWPDIAQKVRVEPKLVAADIDAYTWLRANSQPDDVVMTRLPWQFNWQTERPALMVPNTIDPQVFLRIARYYNVRYLVLDSAQRPNTDVRAMIDDLLENPQLGFEKEYEATSVVAGRAPITTEVYRFPQTYGGVAAIQP